MKENLKKPASILIVFFMVMGLLSGVSLTVKANSSQACSKISTDFTHSFAIKNDGSLWAWGEDLEGELGDGTIGLKYEPVKIMDGVNTVSAGSEHSLLIKNDGSLWACGQNNYGQLGDGTTDDKHAPEKIMDGVTVISAGSEHSLAVKNDRSLWAWGHNESGSLGDGTIEDKNTPEKIMDGVTSVSAGTGYSLVIKNDGSLWAWGMNNYGQLGDGTTEDKHAPEKIMDGVTAVSAGNWNSLAIKKDGSLWAWGYNQSGSLGDGTTEDKYTPEKIMDGVTAVSAGDWYSLVIKNNGSLWAWGENMWGGLGDGTTEDKHTPEKIMDGVTAVSAGGCYSLARKNDGSLWAWGTLWNVGDGGRVDSTTPEKIMDGIALEKTSSPTSKPGLVQQTIMLNVGDKLDLTKYLNLNGAAVTWKSNNTNAATVNNGEVTAVGEGSSIINVIGQDGTQYGIFTINVNNNNVNKGNLKTIRLGGKDRYETSAVISQAGWKNGSTYAVLANGDNYPDALGAAPLAKKYNSPILLTNTTNSMPQSIYNEIKRLNVNHIFICGGIGVVPKAVESQLNSMGITTERLGGKDRYETSVLIAKKLGVVSGEVMTTNGYEWSDALSASSIAAKKGIPIILTGKDKLPDPTGLFLHSSHFNKTYILGDTDLVGNTVANEFPNSERIVGSTEYERNINIIKRFQNDIDFSNICIASGKNFPDALSGSALATMVSSAIVLVDNSDLQSITTQYASQNLMKVNNVYVFGLQGSVNDDIIKKLFSK